MDANLDRLLAMFEKMADDGFDTTKPLKWGFFFVDVSEEKLMEVFDELKDHDYAIEELQENDDGMWVLQVCKTQVLSAEQLHRRNLAFNDLAAHVGIDSYDGWDVSKP